MLVSAFWHGIHSGYYLSLLTCPLYMVVEDLWERRLRRRLPETVRGAESGGAYMERGCGYELCGYDL